MSYKHETVRVFESTNFPGVKVYLNKMTEGRRISLRAKLSGQNKRVRDIVREQQAIEKATKESQDTSRWMELQDDLDQLVTEEINPAWVEWGVKRVDGLEIGDTPLDVADWRDWPSALFAEVLQAVKEEADLNGGERKNLSLPTTSFEQVGTTPPPSTAEPAKEKDSGNEETVDSTFQPM